MTTKLFNWGNAVVLLFVLFAGFICTMVYFMSVDKVELISDDYYQTELDFQKQIEKIKNTSSLKDKISMNYQAAENSVKISFPTVVQKGQVIFFRPSNRDLDKIIPLSALETSVITLPTNKLLKGIWKIKINWNDGKQDYFSEQEIKI